jgi:hypothetical protein
MIFRYLRSFGQKPAFDPPEDPKNRNNGTMEHCIAPIIPTFLLSIFVVDISVNHFTIIIGF